MGFGFADVAFSQKTGIPQGATGQVGRFCGEKRITDSQEFTTIFLDETIARAMLRRPTKAKH